MKSDAERFNELKTTLQNETGRHSNLEYRYAHPAHKEIVEMGVRALPLIMEDLKKEPHWWLKALEQITGHSFPVQEDERGKLKLQIKKWLDWWDAYIKSSCKKKSD